MAPVQTQLLNIEAFMAPTFIKPSIQTNRTNILPKKPVVNELFNQKATLESALNNLFVGTKEENRIQQARQILGEAVVNLSDEELKTYITEFQTLLESWLDIFEKQLFENKTLKQLLKEG